MWKLTNYTVHYTKPCFKMVLSPIYRKHEKSILEIKRAACEDAAVDKLTKGAVDDLIDEAWAASLDAPAFKALFDEARSACEACEIPSDDETDEADAGPNVNILITTSSIIIIPSRDTGSHTSTIHPMKRVGQVNDP